jgi:hypothetical protein
MSRTAVSKNRPTGSCVIEKMTGEVRVSAMPNERVAFTERFVQVERVEIAGDT